jgi:uncharacterized protein (TIGR02172 family)
MKTTLENNTLTIYLEGRIDTNNASTVESDIFAAVHANPGAEIIVDAEKLGYISSAGLRVLMKLRKQVKKALSVLNVSRDVYDIFETTGFTELLDVKKALRVVSVEGCEKIGEGGVGAVYRLDKDTIIKVFKDKMTSASSESEIRMAKKAFQMGVPTAISYDVVKVGDGIGIVYELIDSDTLANEIMEQPDRLSEYARDYVNLLLEIQNIKVKPGELDDARTVLMRYAEGMAYFFPKEEVDKLRGLAATIPEGDSFVHGDFHLKNIMVQNGEFLLIDMGGNARGNRMIDLAGTGLVLKAMPEVLAPGKSQQYSGVSDEIAAKMWGEIVDLYCASTGLEKDYVERVVEAYSYYRLLTAIYFVPGMGTDAEKQKVKEKVFEIINSGFRFDA